jgi:hypothetical protein
MHLAIWREGESPSQRASQSSPPPPTGRHERIYNRRRESSTIGTSGQLRFLFKPIVGIASVSSPAVTNKGNEAN